MIEPAPGSLDEEASGFLVGPAVFKTDVGASSSQAGSIPVRLRNTVTSGKAGSRETVLRSPNSAAPCAGSLAAKHGRYLLGVVRRTESRLRIIYDQR